MFRPGGYATIVEPGLAPHEADTFTCAHCNAVVHVEPKMDAADVGGLCRQCMGLICARCVGRGCDPLEEKLARWEARQAARRSYGV